MIKVLIPQTHPMFTDRSRRDLPRSREINLRKNMWLAIGAFLCTGVIEWLEPYEWDLDYRGFYYEFQFEDSAIATLFKLTWGGK